MASCGAQSKASAAVRKTIALGLWSRASSAPVMASQCQPLRRARSAISEMLPFEQGARRYFRRNRRTGRHVGPAVEAVPGEVELAPRRFVEGSRPWAFSTMSRLRRCSRSESLQKGMRPLRTSSIAPGTRRARRWRRRRRRPRTACGEQAVHLRARSNRASPPGCRMRRRKQASLRSWPQHSAALPCETSRHASNRRPLADCPRRRLRRRLRRAHRHRRHAHPRRAIEPQGAGRAGRCVRPACR